MEELNSLTEIEKRRYKLQMLLQGIGGAGQVRLKNARVLVVGIGGMGSQVLQYLTAMGVGTLGFLDFDVIEEANLSHQVFYGMEDIGKLKAVITRKRLSGMNPLIQFNMLNVRLNADNAGAIIPGYDIIVDTTHKKETHYLISDACIRYEKVMVFGSVSGQEGLISVFNYQEGPSYRCAWPEGKEPDALNQKGITGIPSVLPGITGSYLANEVFKIITGITGVLSGRIMIIDTIKYQNSFIGVARDEANFFHKPVN
jgi:sulfur-carrier protein adenylyltransferase/sulfurtransferase